MKIKRTDANRQSGKKWKFSMLHPRKKQMTIMEQIRQERSHLLIYNDNFYIREAYKSLRTNVIFSLEGERESNVIQVTSSMPGEGKSTTSINLAISFAEMGKKTLIVDCDMRKPKLSRLLGVKSKEGLSNVLLYPDRWKDAVTHLQLENLSMLSAGDIPPNPSELLGSKHMTELVNRLRESYEYVILDTPPVNIVTDAVILSRITDGTLLVVRSGQSNRGSVRYAVNQIQHANAKLMGFVLNGVNQKMGHSGGGYGYRTKDYGYEYSYQQAVEDKVNGHHLEV